MLKRGDAEDPDDRGAGSSGPDLGLSLSSKDDRDSVAGVELELDLPLIVEGHDLGLSLLYEDDGDLVAGAELELDLPLIVEGEVTGSGCVDWVGLESFEVEEFDKTCSVMVSSS